MIDAPLAREDETTWTRLRRRKVVQWGLVYVAASWGFLQGLEYVSESFHWPEQLRQIALIALLIGLPIVVVLAWYHGDRGQQRVTTPEFAILTLLLLLGGGVFWYYQRASEAGRNDLAHNATTTKRNTSSGTKDARPSIAVLPFENRSRLQDDAFFVDGVHDDILTQLSKIGAMQVIARTSVEQFRDTRQTSREISEILGVTHVLEGGVQRAGERVRVTVQLIDARTDTHLWAESYDRELTAANIFAIQSEVAAAIADALKTALTPAELARTQEVPTQNLAAWEAYQLGRQRMAKRTSATLAEAETFFREAIGLDPRFALAYVGLADTLSLRIEYAGEAEEPAVSKAEKAVEEALRLEPELAEAWTSMGGIAQKRRQYERAESMYRRAIALNPNYATARHWYAILLVATGRMDEALVQTQRAAELDPLSAVIRTLLGARLAALGRFVEAEAAFRRAITIDPLQPRAYADLAFLTAYVQNRFTSAMLLARKARELDPGNPLPTAALAAMYRDLGDVDRSAALVADAVKRWPDSRFILHELAMLQLVQSDAAGAAQHAQRVLDAFPRYRAALAPLRLVALQSGRHETALTRYEAAFPELFVQGPPRIDAWNLGVAVDLVLIAQRQGDGERARVLLDGAARAVRTSPRLGFYGYEISDVQILALRGEKASALAALREAERAGWRGPVWRYYRDIEPSLASIRDDPEFKSVFADIDRDMAQQRARLAARPKDAPLNLVELRQ